GEGRRELSVLAAPEACRRRRADHRAPRVNLADLAARRPTHKAFGPEPVPPTMLLELLDVARFAPNHHLTQPWRFRVLGPETLARVRECAGPGEGAKLERAPTLVLATAALSGD